MKIIISPAKKMNIDTESLPWLDLPAFLDRTELLLEKLQSMSYDELKKLWKCNDQIAELNTDRLRRMDLRKRLTPAIASYEGIQYQYMAPVVFSQEELSYIQNHLRILSGFYGFLRPLDGVTPYRLEMQAKLSVCGSKNLYEYWGRSLADSLITEISNSDGDFDAAGPADSDGNSGSAGCHDPDEPDIASGSSLSSGCIINLASKEYSQCISKHLPPQIRFITCIFGEEKDGKVVEKGTLCKMARGEMVRWMAENRIENPEDIRKFSRLEYRYDEERSDETTFVFLKEK